MIELILPLSNMALSPNRKNGWHWRETKSAKDADKDIGYYVTLQQCSKLDYSFSKGDKILAELIFYRAITHNGHEADLDNLLSSFKAMCDGMCNALKINDNQITKIILSKERDATNPRLIVRLTKLELLEGE